MNVCKKAAGDSAMVMSLLCSCDVPVRTAPPEDDRFWARPSPERNFKPAVCFRPVPDTGVSGSRSTARARPSSNVHSLAAADSAQEAILRRGTHQPPKHVMAMYTSVEWETLCREVSKLKLKPRSGEEVASELEVAVHFKMSAPPERRATPRRRVETLRPF